MNYYAITINNKKLTDEFKSIRQVYESFSSMPLIVNIIARERNEFNENTHYHLLITAKAPIVTVKNEYIWWKELATDLDVIKYQEYIKKDGNYKVYNAIKLDSIEDSSPYSQMVKDCETYDKFSDLLRDNPHYIKNIHKLKLLWDVIKNQM